MATKAFDVTELSLQNEKDVTIKPLPVGRLRRFMDAWEKVGDLGPEDDGYGVYINCCGIALEHEFKGEFDALKATLDQQEQGEFLSPEYKEYLEEVLDLDTIYVILEKAGGINVPKLLEEMERLTEAARDRIQNQE